MQYSRSTQLRYASSPVSYMESGLQSSPVTKLTATHPDDVCVYPPSLSPHPMLCMYTYVKASYVNAAVSYDQATLFHEEYGSWSSHVSL